MSCVRLFNISFSILFQHFGVALGDEDMGHEIWYTLGAFGVCELNDFILWLEWNGMDRAGCIII
jgi:hypothetical protein